ncbi:MAG: hypothetical protein Q8N99_03000 [Nanoarchaeota archaeon]|nr:hypothetical protein [Nanoarchaeota archaeon]
MAEVDDIIYRISPYYSKTKKPGVDYTLIYDSTSETLEPIYFWLIDFMEKTGYNPEKLIDNFASSPGSGHFSELQGKASQMQQEASRVLGTVNNILKGVLNLIYDLKEFKIRLSHYEAANSSDKIKKETGILALKQIWMDKVDIQRGQGSLNALSSGNLQFVTLRDAFMMVNSPNEVDDLDLNDRVKRILKPRIQEFFEWRKNSGQELKKRFEIEKIYLKSQVQALKLNARWAKPYLKAANRLTQNDSLSKSAALVTAFNTIMMQLSILGKNPVVVKGGVEDKRLPREFKKITGLRQYYKVIVLDFTFRGIPYKQGPHYNFGGRAEVFFRAYSLNQDEIDLLYAELDESDLKEALGFIEGMTEESLEKLKIDIEEFTTDKDEKKIEEFSDPFSLIFSFFKPKTKPDKKDEEKKKKERIELLKKKGIKSENYAEKYIRAYGEAESKTACFSLYDIYKKSAGMATFPYLEDAITKIPRTGTEVFLGLNKRKL